MDSRYRNKNFVSKGELKALKKDQQSKCQQEIYKRIYKQQLIIYESIIWLKV
tara:strand:- start:2785 stop:2940 length:156 start_codon:yes stop_codon:yes gene_type:complete